MKYSIFLQDPFDFSAYWMWWGIGILLVSGALWYLLRSGLLGRMGRRLSDGAPFRSNRMSSLKNRHISNIRMITEQFGKGRIDSREACQQMSEEVRRFAQKVTGLPMTNLVYTELLNTNYPEMTGLIGEMYEPEFARQSEADAVDMAVKCEELIRKWQ